MHNHKCYYELVNGLPVLRHKCPDGMKCPPYAAFAPIPENVMITFPIVGSFAGDPGTRFILHPRDDANGLPAFLEFFYVDDQGTVQTRYENLDTLDFSKETTFASPAATKGKYVQITLNNLPPGDPAPPPGGNWVSLNCTM